MFFFQLQKRKEREEQLEDVIQAYEKIHMEKNNLQRDLDKMVRDIIQFTALSGGLFDMSAIWLINENIKCKTQLT